MAHPRPHAFGRLLVLPALLAVGLLGAGCTDDPTADKDAPKASEDAVATVKEQDVEQGDVARSAELEPVEKGGISGEADIEATKAGEVRLRIRLQEETGTHAVRAVVGACQDASGGGLLSEVASYELSDIENGELDTTVDLPDDVVAEGEYALVVHESDSTDSDVAACAQVSVE